LRSTGNERLRRAREALNLTQADVARRLGSSTLTVSRWELGVQTPQPYHREQLCRLYGVSAQELGLVPDTPPSNGSGPAAAEVPLAEPPRATDHSDTVPPAAESPVSVPQGAETPIGELPIAESPAVDGVDLRVEAGEARARRDLLAQVEQYWFGSRLEAPSDPLPQMQLALVERPGAVDDPRSVGARPTAGDRPLPYEA